MKNSDDFLQQMRRRRRQRTMTTILTIFFLLCAFVVIGILLYHVFVPPVTEPSLTEPQPSKEATRPTREETRSTTAPATTSPETTSSMEETVPSLEQRARAVLDGMTQEEKIYQLFIVRPEALLDTSDPATAAGMELCAALVKQPVGGVVFFSDNILDPVQCRSMITNLQGSASVRMFIAVDEEGGSVARIGSNPAMGPTQFPPMGEIGRQGDPERAYDVGITIGKEIALLGFNLNMAPVADVNTNPNNPVIGTRAFSPDPAVAAGMVASCVRGFTDSGVLSCIKHFPGHGDTETDSHQGYAETQKTLEQMKETELIPFCSGIQAGVPMVMAGHITCPNVTSDGLPASLSPYLITVVLRGSLGFSGVVITDSLEMEAITDAYSPGEAAVLALQSGCDMLLMPKSLSEAVSGIQNALETGTLSAQRIDESVLRILTLKLEYGILT